MNWLCRRRTENNKVSRIERNNGSNNDIYLKSNIQCSVDCTQYGLYNLKQYDHNQILNELVIYVLNETMYANHNT